MDPWEIILYPYMTEKSIKNIATTNEIVFIVTRASTKKQIKWAVQRLFEVKVKSIRTLIDTNGTKKAFVKLMPEFKATDIATKFGML